MISVKSESPLPDRLSSGCALHRCVDVASRVSSSRSPGPRLDCAEGSSTRRRYSSVMGEGSHPGAAHTWRTCSVRHQQSAQGNRLIEQARDSHDLCAAGSYGTYCARQRVVERRPAGTSVIRRAGIEQSGAAAPAPKSSGVCFRVPRLAAPLRCFSWLDMRHAHVAEDQAVVRVRRTRVRPVG